MRWSGTDGTNSHTDVLRSISRHRKAAVLNVEITMLMFDVGIPMRLYQQQCLSSRLRPFDVFFFLRSKICIDTIRASSRSVFFSSHATNNRRQDLAFLLRSCISIQTHHSNLPKILSRIIISGLASDVFINNLLLNVYSKHGQVNDGRVLFDRMVHRNLISWSTVMSMYAQHDLGEEAIRLFVEFRRCSLESANEFILASVLRACVHSMDVGFATQIHGFVVRAGFDLDVYVGTSLVNFYSKAGLVDAAKFMFDEMPMKNSVTWTAIIVGYSQIGKNLAALEMFELMLEMEQRPDKFAICSALSTCSSLDFLDGGRQIHGYLYRYGVELDISVNNVLLNFYAKCNKVELASKLFQMMDVRNIVSWSTMIAGYMQNSCHSEALMMFAEMNHLGWMPDAFACTSVMTTCGSLMAFCQGKQIHAYVIKGNLECDGYVKNGLIDMYAKCDFMADARTTFDSMLEHNTVSYNAMIEGYASHENLVESVRLFNKMRSSLLFPNFLTFVSLLGVAASKGDIYLSKQIHGLVIKYGEFLDLYSGCALIDVYSKCSCMDDAKCLFDEMEERDLVVWNALILGYTLNDRDKEALRKYSELCVSGIRPNEFTFVAVVTAASNLASSRHGLQFHCQIIKSGAQSDSHISNALMDMYAKCGSINEARVIFNDGRARDVVCWNSIISRYAEHGHAQDALGLFEQMLNENIMPNNLTFIGVLSACSHVGLIEDGLLYFNSMKSDFNIEPEMEHYACIVDLLGRSGRLTEAKEFIEAMPFEPSAIIWRSLLGACRISGDNVLGKYAAKMAMMIEPTDSGSYVLLSNLFASKEMWADAKKLRNEMNHSKVVKEPGHTWI